MFFASNFSKNCRIFAAQIFKNKMGVFLKFVFFSLLFSWLLNQLAAPFMDEYQKNERKNKSQKPSPKTKPEPPKEVIKYRKIDPEEGEYVDYEELK
jgi:hypothetical protein